MAKVTNIENPIVSTLATSPISGYPVNVHLRAINPYGTKVVCNGIVVYTTKNTKINNKTQMNKLNQIKSWLIIETIA